MSKLGINVLKFGSIVMSFEPKKCSHIVHVHLIRLYKANNNFNYETVKEFNYDTRSGKTEHIVTGHIGTESGSTGYSNDIDAYMIICGDYHNLTVQFLQGSQYCIDNNSNFFTLSYSFNATYENIWSIDTIHNWLKNYWTFDCAGDDTDGLQVCALDNSVAQGENSRQFQYGFDINPGKEGITENEEGSNALFTIDNGSLNVLSCILSKGNSVVKSTGLSNVNPKYLDFRGELIYPENDNPYFQGNLVLAETESLIVGNLMLEIKIQ